MAVSTHSLPAPFSFSPNVTWLLSLLVLLMMQAADGGKRARLPNDMSADAEQQVRMLTQIAIYVL